MTPGDGQVAQLIRVPSYRSAVVQPAGLTAPAWDGSTGGVVALFVNGVLDLQGDIDVSEKGFRGAQEDQDYTGDCAFTAPDDYDSAFYHNHVFLAGRKGEGTTDTRFSRLRGRARNINGGGGGNAKLSGGGGGSNYTSGGMGGKESSECSPGEENRGGMGGFDLSRPGSYYVNNNWIRGNRIFFGGGGGTGTLISGHSTTGGGDGGGLVVIVADTLKGNGHWIDVDGEDVTAVATGAAGGGGGGGGIILDVSGYTSTLNLSAVGGNGGNTNHVSDTTGPGGGGGGGVYWMAGDTHSEVNMIVTNGESGEYLSAQPINYGATDGGAAAHVKQLEAPLRGFIFNAVPSEFTVCSDQLPDPILASEPKGGDGSGSYTYQWVDSSSTQNFWDVAPGISDQQHYTFPAPLSDTTYFRRIVTSGLLDPNTSFRIAVYVHPAITGNTISAPDTVCRGDAPQLFQPSATIGGGPTGGSYTYQWQKIEDAVYSNADGASTDETYQAPGLDVTTEFVRIAYSGVCVDTSNSPLVKVWEPLTGNDITPYDTICYSTIPDQMTGPEPGQGDPADKRYQWESASLEAGPWTMIGGATSQNYQSPALTQTTWFRRVAYSGEDDACVDASSAVEVLNIPLVTGNTIAETQTVCTGDQAAQLTGSDPGGGYQGQYSYQWEAKTKSTSWTPVTSVSFSKIAYDPGVMSGDTISFRRVVGSGGMARNVCQDYGNLVDINILPPINNNQITTFDDVKCQGDPVELLLGSTPGGGATQGGTDGTRLYKWEVASHQDNPVNWVHPGVGGEAISYSDPSTLDSEHDRWYRRIVFSGPSQVCADTSNVLRLEVHTAITNNTIVEFDSVCFADSKVLLGETPAGELGLTPVFTWRDLDSGTDIPGSDLEDFTTGVYTDLNPHTYERVVTIGECTHTSDSMRITVMQLPGGHLTDAAYQACEKDTLFAIDLNMDQLSTYVNPWEVYLKNGITTGIGPIMISGDGNLAHTLDINTDSVQLNYEIESIVYRSVGERFVCTSPQDSITGVVPVHVYRRPEPRIWIDQVARDSFKVCNTTVELIADPDNGNSSWSSNPPATVLFTPGGAADSYLASIPNISEAFGKYELTFTSEAGDCYGEDQIDIHYFEQPENAYAGEDTMIFLNNTIQLRADPPTAGIGTWVVAAGDATIEDIHAHNTSAYNLSLGAEDENRFTWTVTNGEDEGTCTTTDDFVVVIRNEVKRYKGFSPDQDDYNEYYIMQGLKYADKFEITFFNSLGALVRTVNQDKVGDLVVDQGLVKDGLKEDELVVWDGRNDDLEFVPSGTYYFVVTFTIYHRDPVSGEKTETDPYTDTFTHYVIVAR